MRGHVGRSASGAYVLVESVRHGFPFSRQEEPLVVTAMPVMERLRDDTGETVLLSTLNARGDMRRLAKCVSPHPVRYDVKIDSPIAAYCTATGRVLLAFAPRRGRGRIFRPRADPFLYPVHRDRYRTDQGSIRKSQARWLCAERSRNS